jgi:hypothetical protein
VGKATSTPEQVASDATELLHKLAAETGISQLHRDLSKELGGVAVGVKGGATKLAGSADALALQLGAQLVGGASAVAGGAAGAVGKMGAGMGGLLNASALSRGVESAAGDMTKGLGGLTSGLGSRMLSGFGGLGQAVEGAGVPPSSPSIRGPRRVYPARGKPTDPGPAQQTTQ